MKEDNTSTTKNTFEKNEVTPIEPNEYFEDLKNRIGKIDDDKLSKSLTFFHDEILKAERLGQKNILHKMAYMSTVIEREMFILSCGFSQYVLRDDALELVDKVVPKNSIKVCELQNYPRSIPEVNAIDIEQAKALDVFDEIVVFYTDYTDEEVTTPAQKAEVARNTDPVVFGIFMNQDLNLQHERLYLITDWEDEFCDLTFSKMVEKMSEVGIKKPEKNIELTGEYINAILENMKKENETVIRPYKMTMKKNFRQRIVGAFQNVFYPNEP